jgi:hypothetical protein
MSVQQSNFLKWFAGIAAMIMVVVITWTFTVLGNIDVLTKSIEYNALEIQETRVMHNSDALLIRDNIKEIKTDLKDIKIILMNKK